MSEENNFSDTIQFKCDIWKLFQLKYIFSKETSQMISTSIKSVIICLGFSFATFLILHGPYMIDNCCANKEILDLNNTN